MRTHAALAAMLLALAGCATPAPVKQLAWGEIAARPVPPVAAKVFYGREPLQYGELRLPAGEGPFPVAMLVHGGCWLADYDLKYMGHLAGALQKMGVATWNVEYRRVGNGGGWPATFRDVAAAADKLGVLAKDYPLDLKRALVLGHSAGGQLALWLASRAQSPGFDLYKADPLPFAGVVGLAPIVNLASYSLQENCGSSVVPLMGGTPQERPERYGYVSPIERLPLRVPQRLVVAEHDPIVPLLPVEMYAQLAEQRLDDVELDVVEGAGHFDLITEDGAGWPLVRAAVEDLLKKPLP